MYDDAGGAMAARAWWMLRWAGHAEVAVLNGGLAAWTGPIESGPAQQVEPSDFQPGDPLTRLITVDELMPLVEAGGHTLVDARAPGRFSGAEDPIDPVAGHIPGAVCTPFGGNLDEQGLFKPAQQLAARLPDDPDAIYYCGSGVTAAHNILAAHIAGLPEPILYADSWSGWIRDPDRPVATGS